MGSCSLRSNERIHLYPFFCVSFIRVICYDQLALLGLNNPFCSFPGLPTSNVNDQLSSTASSAFHRFTSVTMAAPTSSATATTSLTSATVVPITSSNHNTTSAFQNKINLVSKSPNRNYPDKTSLEVTSSPTSSTASDSHSPPTIRKRSQGRQGKNEWMNNVFIFLLSMITFITGNNLSIQYVNVWIKR